MPSEGSVSRFGLEFNTWQEPLQMQDSSGNSDSSVANYKGWAFNYERQLRTANGGYGLLFSIGSGQASGGSTSPNFVYGQDALSWIDFSVEPRLIWTYNEQIDTALGVAAFYRSASWPDTVTYQVQSAHPVSGVFFVELDIALSAHFGFRQAFGLESATGGPFFRWGLTYDL